MPSIPGGAPSLRMRLLEGAAGMRCAPCMRCASTCWCGGVREQDPRWGQEQRRPDRVVDTAARIRSPAGENIDLNPSSKRQKNA
jgi:hypothetical protein